jgi:hypothetical protein
MKIKSKVTKKHITNLLSDAGYLISFDSKTGEWILEVDQCPEETVRFLKRKKAIQRACSYWLSNY